MDLVRLVHHIVRFHLVHHIVHHIGGDGDGNGVGDEVGDRGGDHGGDVVAAAAAHLDTAHLAAVARLHPLDLHALVRNRLLRLTADSPDLLAVIKAEGRV